VQGYLDAAVAQSQARGGQVAVLDAHTGQVLALASAATFNPADPATISDQSTRDPAIQSVFEPGSVNKLVTFSAALEKGLIKPSSVFTVPDTIEMGGIAVHDAWSHPPQRFTATGVLAASSNVGTLEIAQQLGPVAWYDYERRFGIGSQTGIELPGESAGILPPMSSWSYATFANFPIGQGEAMTILQLASMYQTIANDGVRVPPRIVESVTRSDGSTEAEATPAGSRVVSAKSARTVRTMLESTILPGGTGVKAAIPGYRVAGKTGTAQQPTSSRRCVQRFDVLGHVRGDRARRQPAVRGRHHDRQSGPRIARRGRGGPPVQPERRLLRAACADLAIWRSVRSRTATDLRRIHSRPVRQ
jgi:cell division protein FtsI (penicillin-binding protein 3)